MLKILICALLSTVVAAVTCQILGLPPLLGHLHADGFIVFVASYVLSSSAWEAVATRLAARKLWVLKSFVTSKTTTTPLTRTQRLDFAYSNLAMSTRHRPGRDAFRKVALDIGMSEDDFIAWARDKEWK